MNVIISHRNSSRYTRRVRLAAVIGAVLAAVSAPAAMLGGRAPAGFAEAFGLGPEQLAKDYKVQLIRSSVPANVLWPGDEAVFTLQFVNGTAEPLKATGKVEFIRYATMTNPSDVFSTKVARTGDAGSVPIQVDLPPNGYANITVKPALPATFGPYALVVDLPGHGRQFAVACVRTPAAVPGRVQYPSYAMDLRGGSFLQDAALFQRLGIKGARLEIGYVPTTSREFYPRFAALAEQIGAMRQNDITVMLTIGGSGPQPMGRNRPHLDAGLPIKFTFRVNDNDPKTASLELAAGRSVSQINSYALHDYWMTSWANEVSLCSKSR